MNIEDIRLYCLSKAHTSEDFPFDSNTLAFRVGGKIFALTSTKGEANTINLKCDPEQAIELREEYPEDIVPGYHMNKEHWNTVNFQNLPTQLLHELIDQSYQLVIDTIPKQKQKDLGISN